jgi:hypothetical protein
LGENRLGALSVTVFWFCSSGQGQSMQLLHIPSQIVLFLSDLQKESTRRAWADLVDNGWPKEDDKINKRKAGKKKSGHEKPVTGPGISRNFALQDLFAIYSMGTADASAARRFVRRHLVPPALSEQRSEDDWQLIELFLKEVLGMSPSRIEAVKQFSDKLAQYVAERNNKGLLQRLLRAEKLYEFRSALVKVQRREYVDNDELLFTLEEFVSVLEADEAVGISDWSMVRDLISIRVVQMLKELGYRPGIALKEEEDEQELEKIQPVQD